MMAEHKLIILISCLLAVAVSPARSATCQFVPPAGETNQDVPEFGFIMIPGAQIAGEAYRPLALKIQSMFPGRLWLGLTDFFLADFPNPIEISSAISACLDQATAAGVSTSLVYMGGHSLGGVVLESYIKDHPELTVGIIMLGSYLPSGWIGTDDNIFPVPVLTAIGSLDGGSISYMAREARETQLIDETMPELKGRFPVHVIQLVNHAQVASGEMPSIVTDHDIDAEVDGDEAHSRYAKSAVAFMVTQKRELFQESEVAEWDEVIETNQLFTDEFLEPFQRMAELEEKANEAGEKYSEWTNNGQKILLGLSDEESLLLQVENSVVSFLDLGGVKPSVESTGECTARVMTYSYNSYSFDPIDAGSTLSAEVIKSKFKLEDVVGESICLPDKPRLQCKDINKAAYDLALSVSSPEAVERLTTKGRQLSFIDDDVASTGPGWEFSSGLQYTNVSPTLTEVRSVSLISEPDFIIPSAAGMHYCDLLSPYRALEWIYIKGVVHGNQ